LTFGQRSNQEYRRNGLRFLYPAGWQFNERQGRNALSIDLFQPGEAIRHYYIGLEPGADPKRTEWYHMDKIVSYMNGAARGWVQTGEPTRELLPGGLAITTVLQNESSHQVQYVSTMCANNYLALLAFQTSSEQAQSERDAVRKTLLETLELGDSGLFLDAVQAPSQLVGTWRNELASIEFGADLKVMYRVEGALANVAEVPPRPGAYRIDGGHFLLHWPASTVWPAVREECSARLKPGALIIYCSGDEMPLVFSNTETPRM